MSFWLYLILAFLSIIILIVAFYYTSTLIFSLTTKVPPVSSPAKLRKELVKILKLKPGQVFYDLGSAYGKLLIEVDRQYPKAKIIGFEIAPFCLLVAKANLFLNKSGAKIYYKNFYKISFSEADVFFCYLWPSVMNKIKEKFLKQARRDSRLYIYAFPLPKIKADHIFKLTKNKKIIKIYQYIKK